MHTRACISTHTHLLSLFIQALNLTQLLPVSVGCLVLRSKLRRDKVLGAGIGHQSVKLRIGLIKEGLLLLLGSSKVLSDEKWEQY